jgi:phosphopantothenoylcysteine decarboxylase/phosphopantothenate--cysteine ligase
VLLGVSGGIAAWKAIPLLRRLQDEGVDVRVAMTEAAQKFVGVATFRALSQAPVATELWDLEQSRGGEAHVELGAWADAVVIYPATADLMGRLSAGQADDVLLLSILCARGPVLLCPAMHERMWRSPLVQGAVRALQAAGMRILPPTVGRLASGEVGEGRLPEPEEVLEATLSLLTVQDLSGLRVVVSGGPTREHLDPVRFLSNPSTGRMGDALARMAARRGASVDLVRGPTELAPPGGVRVHAVVSAGELKAQVDRLADGADVVVMSAAVADFRPAERSEQKVKKGGAEELHLLPTDDVLLGLAERRGAAPRPLLVGFAMETENLLAHAEAKLRRKRLDLLVANDLREPGAGFSVATNAVWILTPDGAPQRVDLASKAEVASRVWDAVLRRLA